jgi:two-component system, NarL family, nitrate/nitrite response regulator NarL
MNLLLVDDHALFREGLRSLLANVSPGVAIYEAATVEGALDECRTTSFHMVLLDLGLADTGGLDTLDAFRSRAPDVPVVVLSGDQEPRRIRSAVERGAMGFIPKSHTSDQMIAALRWVISGEIYLPPHVFNEAAEADQGIHDGQKIISAAFARLSPRQEEVAQLLLQGRSNKFIARQLNVSEGTVKAHVSAIFQIIGAKTRVEAVMIAAKCGIKIM